MMKRLCIVAFFVILFCSLAILVGCQMASEQTSAVGDKTTNTSAGYGAPGYGKQAPGYGKPSKEEAPAFAAPGYEAHTEGSNDK